MKHQSQEPQHLVVKQAIHWMLRLRNNGDNARLHQQCDSWRAAHHDHEWAWQRVQTLNRELSTNLRAVPGASIAFETLETSAQRLSRRQALKMLAGVMMVGSAAWVSKDLTPWDQWTSDFATGTGERRAFQLPDGSRLELNTRSAADLTFDARQRLVALKQGELMLTCGADPQTPGRPLLVRTRHGLFEGFNGRFMVRQERDCTRVSVSEGRVAIHSPGNSDGTGLQWVLAGQAFKVTATAATPLLTQNMDAGAWADGLIVTRNMRLADFLAEVGRYRNGHLSCADDIADLQLSGVFRLDDTEKLLQILPQTLPVKLHYRTRWWVRLERMT
ncbi:FecR family protein [Pseudomonas sp. LS1212]|uniref:FecR domain-containing protein n=1 Tax=Pseudomonas sp. LS1212 TaxID=2972478 RepID=UPI00215C028A|nr:FecR family protein [Pseudomonas sp. LS1212]UVJ44146.1 FecR family protein [Pseudomonas sp. LS1212]